MSFKPPNYYGEKGFITCDLNKTKRKKRYKVVTSEVLFRYYIIDARSRADAAEKVRSGDVREVDVEYGDTEIEEISEEE